MKVKLVKTDEVIPYARNPRNNESAVDKVASSIYEYGFQQPIVCDVRMVVIAGHTRLLAAKKLGLGKVPVVIADGLTSTQAKAYRLADNRVGQEATWDQDLLKLEIADLSDLDFNLLDTGFDQNEIDALLALTDIGDGQTDEDDTPDPPADPVTKPGDVWLLGKHRLICGDCTDALVVERLLGDVQPHLMVTDPPYGVEYDPGWRATAGINRNRGKQGKVENDGQADWRDAWALFPGDVAYVWHAGRHASEVQASLEAAQFVIRCQIIWAKDRFALSRGDYHWQHEPCWYAVKKTANGHWNGDRKQSTLWQIKARDDAGHGHGTQKPVECMRRPIENNSNPGQVVYDPFLGSGTTIIASESIGRFCYGVELNPTYCDVIVKRWEDYTGKKASREARKDAA